MQIEEKRAGKNPFQAHCDSAMFFPGGGRGAIFDDLKTAFREDVNLVTLIGEEGSGKTMLCKMLEEQWDTSRKVVFLPQVVGSFEEIVRVTVTACDGDFPVETNRVDARKIFLQLVASLKEQGSSLLLLCDEAEKMYLATLERIRKILDDVNKEGGGLQVLFSGRTSLRGNLEQLTLCNFEKISEKQFFLSPLDEKDTWEYLNFCVQDQEEDERREVFTREAAEKIASMARGNMRMTNILADESLQSSNADTSFLVLLDHVKDSCSIEDIISVPPGFLQRFSFLSQYVIPAGIGVVLLLLFLIFSGDDQAPEEAIVISPPIGNGDDVATQTETPVPGGTEEPADVVPVEEISSPAVMTAAEEVTETPPLAPPMIPADVEAVLPPVAVETGGEQGIVVRPVETVEQLPPESEDGGVTESESTPAPSQHTPVEISPVEIVDGFEIQQTVPELSVNGEMPLSGETERIVAEKVKKIPAQPGKIVFAQENLQGQDPILGKLITAGKAWQAGAMNDQYTIQLMVLTSDQAEGNLKQIIIREEYRDVVDDLVMLKRPSDPPVVLVFYGLYPSMAAARNARNNMPIALRSHHPYAVSVQGAVEKSRLEQ